jgi:hypothetical protein
MQSFGRKRSQAHLPLCSFVSFVVLLCLIGCAGESKHPTWKNLTGAEQTEQLMWKAIQEKDWTNVGSHLSGTFVGVNSSGQLFDRDGWLQLWKSAAVKEYSLGEIEVHPEGPDMKVTYIIQLQGDGLPAEPQVGLRVVSVWQQLKKGWILSATSMTPVQNSTPQPSSH